MTKAIVFSKIVFVLLCVALAKSASARDLNFSASCGSPSSVVTISFVGDILVHEALYRSVVDGTQSFRQIWRRTDSLIKKADFSVGNLEGPAALGVDARGRDRGDVGFIYDEVVYSGSNFSFNYHPRILRDLKDSGYDLLTVANNHSLDRTFLGIDKTLTAGEALSLPLVGVRHSSARNGDFHKILNIGDLRVAFLGCTEMTNGYVDQKDQILFCYKNPGRILGVIKDLAGRNDVDAIVVLPHWGQEYSHTPNTNQRSFARRYLEAGATAVIGSHPHVLQPWEKYVTQDGRETLIAYSLGNYVAGQAGLARKTGVVLYVGLGPNEKGQARIVGVGYTPTYREGVELYPVVNSRDVLDHAQGFFGASRRVPVMGDLISSLCRKNLNSENGKMVFAEEF